MALNHTSLLGCPMARYWDPFSLQYVPPPPHNSSMNLSFHTDKVMPPSTFPLGRSYWSRLPITPLNVQIKRLKRLQEKWVWCSISNEFVLWPCWICLSFMWLWTLHHKKNQAVSDSGCHPAPTIVISHSSRSLCLHREIPGPECSSVSEIWHTSKNICHFITHWTSRATHSCPNQAQIIDAFLQSDWEVGTQPWNHSNPVI